MKRLALVFMFVAMNSSGLYAESLKDLHEKPISSLEELRKYADSLPSQGERHYALGLGYLTYHREQEAWGEFEKILRLDPGNGNALWGKAEILRRNSEYKKSLEILDEVLKKNPEHVPSLITKSYTELLLGALHQSIKTAAVVERLQGAGKAVDKPNLARAYLIIATAQIQIARKSFFLGKLQALSVKWYIMKAVEINPEAAEVRFALGNFYLFAPGFWGGNVDAAISEFNKTLHKDPQFMDAYVRLVQAYRKKNDVTRSQFYLEKIKELDPRNKLAKELGLSSVFNNDSLQ
ncbi:MAG: tetratricopeptide repeat protein [Candidatus Omnitrophota bacterium]